MQNRYNEHVTSNGQFCNILRIDLENQISVEDTGIAMTLSSEFSKGGVGIKVLSRKSVFHSSYNFPIPECLC